MTPRPWLATYGSTIPAEINADAYPSVVAMLEHAIARYASKTAFVGAGARISYAQVDELSRDFCAYLQRIGVRKGDRVGVMLPNIIAFPIVLLGIIRAGAIQVNINPLYTPRELGHQLSDSGSSCIVVFSDALPTLTQVLAQTPVKHIVVAGRPGVGDAFGESVRVPAELANAASLAAALAEGASLPRLPVVLGGDDTLFLQYTGGTTGASKGAELTHRNLVANVEQFKAFMRTALRDGEEVVVTAIPLYHIFALMVNFLTYFTLGAENWLVANPRDMDGFVAILGQARPTTVMGVNTLYAGLTQHPKLPNVDWSRLRLAGGGGAAVIRTTSERWQAITGKFICEGYGLSETSPVVSFNPEFIREFSGSTGLPAPSTDIKLLDAEDREVPIGEPGEICVRGPQVMRGYWHQPEANASAFTSDGYFRTGDVGVFDARGFLKIVDRKKDMVLVSGFNVYPNEIEAVAAACTGVTECACIGVPDDKTGEAVRLFVVRSANVELSEEQVIAHCRAQLAAYKVPKQVRFIAALPKSTVGKILRRDLRGVA